MRAKLPEVGRVYLSKQRGSMGCRESARAFFFMFEANCAMGSNSDVWLSPSSGPCSTCVEEDRYRRDVRGCVATRGFRCCLRTL